MVHKSIVAFSVGMQLARTHAKRRVLVVLLVVIFASMSPIGGAIGIATVTTWLQDFGRWHGERFGEAPCWAWHEQFNEDFGQRSFGNCQADVPSWDVNAYIPFLAGYLLLSGEPAWAYLTRITR